MRSPTRSLAHAVFFNVGEECMVTTQDTESICGGFSGRDLLVKRLPCNIKLQDTAAL
jgi:hypothetical protein